MSNTTQYQSYITVGLGLLEREILSTLTTLTCCIFLCINIIMLFTLRSKQVFCETSRYILLFNLLLADTLQMALSQLLYLLSTSRMMLTYPVCGVLVMIGNVLTQVSPLTLVVMSLERYVAVCYPLRHVTVITIRYTGESIIVVWAFCCLNVLIRLILLLQSQFEELERLQMKSFCSIPAFFQGKLSQDYDVAYNCFLFISAGITISFSFISVMVAARKASTDKASVQKARNTLLLHLVQLGLSLSSFILNPILVAVSKILPMILLLRVMNVLYVLIVILPRCLSALIYGLRDQIIRPILLHYLCCRLTLLSQQRLKSRKIHGKHLST